LIIINRSLFLIKKISHGAFNFGYFKAQIPSDTTQHDTLSRHAFLPPEFSLCTSSLLVSNVSKSVRGSQWHR